MKKNSIYADLPMGFNPNPNDFPNRRQRNLNGANSKRNKVVQFVPAKAVWNEEANRYDTTPEKKIYHEKRTNGPQFWNLREWWERANRQYKPNSKRSIRRGLNNLF